MVLSISHISPIRAVPVLRLPDFSTFLWLGVVTARSADRPVLTRGAASYPPGLAALPCVLTSLRGLRLARSPLRYRLASPTSRSEPRLLSARPLRGSALPAYRSPTLCVVAPPPAPPAGWSAVLCAASPSPRLPPGSRSAVWHSSLCLRLSVPRSLSLSVGWAGALGAAERAGRCYPRFGAACTHRRASAGRGSAPRRPGERSAPPPGRPSCGPCGISRPRPPGPPTTTLRPCPRTPPPWGGGRPPTSVNPDMTPAGRLGGVV